jgi:hypothetical protein
MNRFTSTLTSEELTIESLRDIYLEEWGEGKFVNRMKDEVLTKILIFEIIS